MSTTKTNFQGVFLLSGGNAVVSVFSFARNILIARLISVEDFGIAATFAMTIMFIELTGNFAVDRLIIQGRDSYSRRFQSGAHSFLVIRGLAGGAFLFFLAGPIATIFKVPEATWAFQTISLLPVLRGFMHLDFVRAQRYSRFQPIVTVEVGASVLVTFLAVPLALWFRSYAAVLYLVMLQGVAAVVLSHLVARRRYQLGWDLNGLRRIIKFGWPLMISGFLLLVVVQGDRFIVATTLTVKELGWFSAAFMTTLVPANLVSKVCLSYFLPLLSKIQDDNEKFDTLRTTMIDITLTLGILYAVGVAIAGPPFFNILFGERYNAGFEVLVFLGVVRSLALARVGPATVAMAKGDTISVMIPNIVRVGSLGLAVAAVWSGYGVLGIVLSSLIGEIAAYLTAVALLHFRLDLEIRRFVFPIFTGFSVMALAIWVSETFITGLNPWIEIPLAIPVLLGAIMICFAGMPRIGHQILTLWHEHSRKNLEGTQEKSGKEPQLARTTEGILPNSERLAARKDAHCQSRYSKPLIAIYRIRRLRPLVLSICNRLEGGPFFSETLRAILARYHGVTVGRYSYGSALVCGLLPQGTTVGAYCSFGGHLTVLRRNHPTDRLTQHPFFYDHQLGFVARDTIPQIIDNPLAIGSDVWIGDNVTIVASCRSIGDGAVVAAGSVVTRDIPAFTIVAGVPAKSIRRRCDEQTEALIRKTRWWDLSVAELVALDVPLTTALDTKTLRALAENLEQRKPGDDARHQSHARGGAAGD